MDTAVSHALLRRAAQGAEPESIRLYVPGDIVAFGPEDVRSPGFRAAVEAARRGGFAAVKRLVGGRAAVYHRATLAFAWTVPDPQPRAGIRARFQELADLLAAALRRLGVDARVGEVPGEYCPGDYSINARGRTKLMGVGQRIIAGAAHVGGVIVVGDSARVREILLPVYAALGLAWDPATAGSVEDEVGPVTVADVEAAVLAELAGRYRLVEGGVSPEALALAERLEPEHRAP